MLGDTMKKNNYDKIILECKKHNKSQNFVDKYIAYYENLTQKGFPVIS